MSTPDFNITNHGSIVTLVPRTPLGREWVDNNLPDDFNLLVEPRYINDIIEGFTSEGLTWN